MTHPLAGRSAAEDGGGETFLPREEWANRGPRATCRAGWQAQGKKVSPPPLRHEAIEAQPSFGQIQPIERPGGSRAPNSIPRRRRGGTSNDNHKRRRFLGSRERDLS